MINLFKKMTRLQLPKRRPRYWSLGGMLLLALICLSGCETTEPESTEIDQDAVVRPPSMQLLVIGDSQLGEIISRQWSARQDGDLTVVTQSTEEFVAGKYELKGGTDIVIYPTGMLGELESRDGILALPRWLWDSEELNRKELLRHHRLSLIRHGDESWAVPLGGPQLGLMYNLDTLNNLDQAPPDNWEQLTELATKLKSTADLKDDNGDPLPTRFELPLSQRLGCANVFGASGSADP